MCLHPWLGSILHHLESIIIKLNGKISSVKKKHNLDRKVLPKTSALRCSKCEGNGHKTHQCPNGDASPMTHEDLKNYISYLREEEERTMQKLYVLKRRQERQGDQQWEDEMMIKKDTSLEIYAHELACLSISNKPMSDQCHTYNLVVCLRNIPFFSLNILSLI